MSVVNGSTVTGIPCKPTGLTAMKATGNNRGTQIELSWTAPADGGDSEITGYKIERSAEGNDPWTVLVPDTGDTAGETCAGSAPADGVAYCDSGLPSPTTRHYRVSAINSFGAGSPSDSASATTDDVVGPVLTEAEVRPMGNLIRLTLDEVPVSAGLPPGTAFTVTADGHPITVSDVGSAIGTQAVRLQNLIPTIKQGQAVVVTYTDPNPGTDDTGGVIQDVAGNDAASFTTGEGGAPGW